MLLNYKKKKLIDSKNPGKTTHKTAGEAIYLTLKLMVMHADRTRPPPFDVFKLIEKVTEPEAKQPWVIDLIKQRIADKKAEYTMTEEFHALIDQALALKAVDEFDCESPTQKFIQRQDFRAQADAQFLSLF